MARRQKTSIGKGASLELHQLRYFREVAKYESVSKAAANLHVSQSAISRSIIKLEQELEVMLFDRHGRKVALNENGTRFLEDVERILADVDSSVYSINPRKDPNRM